MCFLASGFFPSREEQDQPPALTQLRPCRSQARVTAWLGFGRGCSLDWQWLFLARGRKHREGQKCVLPCSAVCTGTCREAAGGKVVHKRAEMILGLKLLGLNHSILFPPVFPMGFKPPCPSINWTVRFRDTLSINFLISQYVAWSIFGNIISSVLSQGDTLPERFERVLHALLVFCNLPRNVFKNASRASAAWQHLHLKHCTSVLGNFVVCTMLWFSMKGLRITDGRGLEWGVPVHFLDS